MSACRSAPSRPGDARYVHEGKNLGTNDVALLVTYVIAEGQPLAQTDLDQCDPPGAV